MKRRTKKANPRVVSHPGMTVGELRRSMEDVPDEMPVTIRAAAASGDFVCGGVECASVESGCAEDEDGNPDPSFVIDASDDIDALNDADASRRAP